MINSIIIWLFQLLVLGAPIVMYSKTSELFEFNKMLFIYGVTAAICAAWVTKMIITKKVIFKKTWMYWPVFLFLGSQILSTLFSIDISTSIFGYYGRFNGGLLSMISYTLLFCAAVSNLSNKDVNTILKTSLLSSLLVILWAVPGKLGHDLTCQVFMGQFNNDCWTNQFNPAVRVFSTLGQPNWMGAYLAINFFIGLYFFLKTYRPNEQVLWYRVAFGFYLLLNFTFVLFTLSRSALVSVIMGLAVAPVLLYFFIKDKVHFNEQMKIYGIFLLILLVPIYTVKTNIDKLDKLINPFTYFQSAAPPVAPPIQQQVSSTPAPAQPLLNTGITESFDIRKIVWQGAIDLGFKYPIFGTGVETFAYAYYFVRPEAHNNTSEWDYLYNKAHNEFLNYFATTGFTGLGLYLALIGATFIAFFLQLKQKPVILKHNLKLEQEQKIDLNNGKLLSICLVLAYISISVTNFFGFSTTTVNMFFFLIPAFIVIASFINHEEKTINISTNNLSGMQYSAISLSGLVLIMTWIYLINYFRADVQYALGDNYAKVGPSQFQTAYEYLNNALQIRTEHVYQDRISYVAANLSYIAAADKQTDLARQLMTLSNDYNEKALQASPKNVLYYKTKVKNYYIYYQLTQDPTYLNNGLQTLDQALQLSPTDPKIPYSQALFYSALASEAKDPAEKKKYQDLSLERINYTLKLKRDYRDAFILKGQILTLYGDKQGAKDVYQFYLDRVGPGDAEMLKNIQDLNGTPAISPTPKPATKNDGK